MSGSTTGIVALQREVFLRIPFPSSTAGNTGLWGLGMSGVSRLGLFGPMTVYGF